jgi:hypothetical protein
MGAFRTCRPQRAGPARGRRGVLAVACLTVTLSALVGLLAAPRAHAAGGELLWAKRYGTAARPAAAVAVAAAPSGAVCVAGNRIGPAGAHLVALRYRADGRRSWVRLYGATRPGEELCAGVACDRSGNVFVAGSAEAGPGDWDIVVLKYRADGRLLWVRRYRGGGGADCHAAAVATDRFGNVIVSGTSRKPGGDLRIAVVKYTPTGIREWVALRGPEVFGTGFVLPGVDIAASDMALDGFGHVYVCGTAQFAADHRAVVLKLRRAEGTTAWARIDTPAAGERSAATAIAVRGNRVAIAATLDAGADWHMMALDFSRTGSPRYRTVYDEGPGSNITASDVVVDAASTAFVGGVTEPASGGGIACVMRVLADGAWVATAYEPLDERAGHVRLALGPTGAVYVAWSDQWGDGATEQDNILVRRFSNSLGDRPWMQTWRGPGHDDDRPCGVVVGTTGGLYVAGTGSAASDQVVVLKYTR